MKKSLVVLLIALAIVALFVGCKAPEVNYEVGGKGPAGGYIFYDCDADNTEDGGAGEDGLKSSECGWRFLEAAPEDLSRKYAWGPNDATTYNTKTGIGEGQNNTNILKDKEIDKFPAAQACVQYKGGGFTDWFLPSRDELKAMYTNLTKEDKGGKWQDYGNWSSSEGDYADAYYVIMSTGSAIDYTRSVDYYVRPVRAFK